MSERPKAEVTARQLEAYRLRYEEGLDYPAVGARLGIGKKVARDHVLKAEKHLGVEREERTKPADRVRKNGARVTGLLDDVRDPAVIKMLREARVETIGYLDQEVLSKESGRGLAQIISALTQNIQLLEGEPTQIIGIRAIKKLDEAAVLLHAEMERRGLIPGPIVDVTPEENEDDDRS